MRPRNMLIFGIVVVSLILGMMYYTQVGWEQDGAPEATITVVIREAGTDNEWGGDVDTDKNLIEAVIGDDVGMKPLTALSADIIGVEPETEYEIEFWVMFNGDLPEGAPADLPMYADVSMGGQVDYNGAILGFMNFASGTGQMDVSDISLSPTEYEGTAAFTKADGTYWDRVVDDTSMVFLLKGKYIDGSVWTCDITTSSGYAGTDAYWGTTTVTITLNVDNTGNVNITVTDVDMTATEA